MSIYDTQAARIKMEKTDNPVGSIQHFTELSVGAGTECVVMNKEGAKFGGRTFNTANAWIKTDGTYKFKDGSGNVVMDNVDGVQMLKDASVTTAAIADLAVDTSKLADLAVDAAKLADSSVESTKIANAAVGSAAIANLAVGTAHIANGAVLEAKIGDAAVTNAKIDNLAVTNAKINDLDAGKINAGTISADRIGANSITASKLNVSTLSAISADMGSVTAGTITGVTITSASGSTYIRLNTGNYLEFVRGGVEKGRIWSDDAGDIYIKGTDDVVFDAGGAARVGIFSNSIKPITGNQIDIGTDANRFRECYVYNKYNCWGKSGYNPGGEIEKGFVWRIDQQKTDGKVTNIRLMKRYLTFCGGIITGFREDSNWTDAE